MRSRNWFSPSTLKLSALSSFLDWPSWTGPRGLVHRGQGKGQGQPLPRRRQPVRPGKRNGVRNSQHSVMGSWDLQAVVRGNSHPLAPSVASLGLRLARLRAISGASRPRRRGERSPLTPKIRPGLPLSPVKVRSEWRLVEQIAFGGLPRPHPHVVVGVGCLCHSESLFEVHVADRDHAQWPPLVDGGPVALIALQILDGLLHGFTGASESRPQVGQSTWKGASPSSGATAGGVSSMTPPRASLCSQVACQLDRSPEGPGSPFHPGEGRSSVRAGASRGETWDHRVLRASPSRPLGRVGGRARPHPRHGAG